jgi:hypothetical protein
VRGKYNQYYKWHNGEKRGTSGSGILVVVVVSTNLSWIHYFGISRVVDKTALQVFNISYCKLEAIVIIDQCTDVSGGYFL